MRRVSGLTLCFLGFFMSYRLYHFLYNYLGARSEPLLGRDLRWLQARLFGLPTGAIAGVDLSAALVISVGIFGYALYMIWEFVSNHEKTIDFLVETEKEMKKVDWPSWQELRGSSIVVVLAVVFLGAYLFTVDVVLSKIIKYLIGIG